MKRFFKYFIPGFIKRHYSAIGKNETPVYGWFGSYSTWAEALSHCSGYDSEVIINKVQNSILKVISGEAEYERDSVAFTTHEYSPDLLKALKMAVTNNELNVMDFGGSLGSTYFQYKRFFEGVKINWMVVEQKHFVDVGNKEIANNELKFFYTGKEAIAFKNANTMLLSSVLPYLEKPIEFIDQLKFYSFENIIIDRNAFIEEKKDILTVQIVPEFIYKASYPAWFFNEQNFKDQFTDKYDLKMEFMSPFALPTIVNDKKVYWKGFLFKKKI